MGRLKGREGESTEWSNRSIQNDGHSKTAHTDKLKSVEGRQEGMSGKNTGCTSTQGLGLGLGNKVLDYLPVQIKYIVTVFSEEKYMH